jgi:hypothetical protein
MNEDIVRKTQDVCYCFSGSSINLLETHGDDLLTYTAERWQTIINISNGFVSAVVPA